MVYKHKGFLFGIGIVIIERGLDIMNINTPFWLGSFLLIFGFSIILWTAFIALKERGQVTDQSSLFVEPPQGISNILSIEQQESSKLPPLWATVIGILSALLLLFFGGFQTYLIASGVLVAKLNWEWILFYLIFGAVPLWILLEPITDRKYYKTGKSATAVEVTFIVKGDITDIFNKCLNITEMMKARITKATAPSSIKARTSKTRISVELQPNNGDVQIKVVCDAIWVTVKIGKGRNQRVIDKFQKHFIDGFRVSKTVNETKALDWVTCDKCGLIGVRNIRTRELEEVEDNQRGTGQPILTRINSLGDTEPRHGKFPECLVQLQDFAKQPFLPLFYMQLPRQCPQFIKWQKGSSPKEHREIIDRQPKSYDKRDVSISNEPEISIDIDKCGGSHYGQSDQVIEVALTLKVENPPINITDLQCYMGDEMLELLSPSMPTTQRKDKDCYIARYKLSLSTIYKVAKDKRDEYRIYVVAMKQKFPSAVFSINNP